MNHVLTWLLLLIAILAAVGTIVMIIRQRARVLRDMRRAALSCLPGSPDRNLIAEFNELERRHSARVSLELGAWLRSARDRRGR